MLASASGLRISELLALRVNDFDFSKSTLRVDESSDQKSGGKIGPCKNAAAYRTVYMLDREGKRAMAKAKEFIPLNAKPIDLIFRSRRQGPLTEQTILVQGLYPALDRLGIERDGFHALRYGCNTRWQLAGLAPVVIRQQMGHSSSDMTDHYTSTLSPEQVQAAFESSLAVKLMFWKMMENGKPCPSRPNYSKISSERASYNGSIEASQASDVGSIPIARSI